MGPLVTLVGDVWRFDRRRVATLLALTGAAAATEGIGIVLLVPVVGGLGDERSPAGVAGWFDDLSLPLGWVLAGFVALVALRALLVRAQAVTAATIQQEWVDDLRTRLFRAICEADMGFVLRARRSDLLQALTSEVARVGMVVQATTTSVVRSALVLAAVAAGVVIAPVATLIAAAATVPTVLIALPLVRRARRSGALLTGRGRAHLATTVAFLDSVRQSKAHATEDAHATAFAEASAEVREALLDQRRAEATLSGVQQVLAAAALALVVGTAVGVFDTPTATLIGVLVLGARALTSVGPLSSAAQQIANLLPAYGSVSELLAEAEVAREARPTAAPLPFSEELRFDAVTVHHPGAARPSLVLDAAVAVGGTTALVGPSGAGKSTALDVLAGLVPPTQGRLVVDGAVLDEDHRRAWRSTVGLVPQQATVLPTSVRDNIAWGSAATDGDVWEALAAARLDAVVAALPAGLDTVLQDGGGLSGGEQQRLALARALVRRPRLLLLDEPTAHLDAVSRAGVVATIDALRGEVTIVIATHAPDEIDADRTITVVPAPGPVPVDTGEVLR